VIIHSISRNGVIAMLTNNTKNSLPLELQQQIYNSNKSVAITKKKLARLREARWLEKIENNARDMQLLFQKQNKNRNRSARIQNNLFFI
jgi:hypothetical protein